MAVFKSLTFDGINSLNYGIYVTGEAVYNAPERVVEMVEIPGRNGSLAIDQGRFTNIEVSYPCGCFADTQAEFASKVSAFRNALCSRYSYKRLTDEYNADEYRLGVYKSGLEVDAVRYGTAGEFTITFDCKPQRFLLDGDAELSPTDYKDLQTKSGDIVQITNDGTLGIKSLTASLDPIQDLNGYDKPWSGGNGKNKMPQPTISLGGTNPRTATVYFDTPLPIGTYICSWQVSGTYTGTARDAGIGAYASDNSSSGGVNKTSGTFVTTKDSKRLYFYMPQTNYDNGETLVYSNFQIELGTTATSYEPYSNICPISGRTEVDTIVSPTTSEQDATVYTTDLGRTVYGGTLDVVSGVLTVDRAIVDLGTLDWTLRSTETSHKGWSAQLPSPYLTVNITTPSLNWITSDYPYVGGTSGSSIATEGADSYDIGVYHFDTTGGTPQIHIYAITDVNSSPSGQLCYELATPQTYQLTPQEVELLLGQNNIWNGCGETEVEYGIMPYFNPTEFESKPLIKVTGTGTLGIGEYILTITGTSSQTLYIDCETMEIYTLEGTVPTGASSLVTINKTDFPVLKPGQNGVSVGTGISALTITPNWWRL